MAINTTTIIDNLIITEPNYDSEVKKIYFEFFDFQVENNCSFFLKNLKILNINL